MSEETTGGEQTEKPTEPPPGVRGEMTRRERTMNGHNGRTLDRQASRKRQRQGPPVDRRKQAKP